VFNTCESSRTSRRIAAEVEVTRGDMVRAGPMATVELGERGKFLCTIFFIFVFRFFVV
jgi:hypothetical protein